MGEPGNAFIWAISPIIHPSEKLKDDVDLHSVVKEMLYKFIFLRFIFIIFKSCVYGCVAV